MDKQRKKELLQSYKEQTPVGGAYVITNTATGKKLLFCQPNLPGSRNRFEFSQQTNLCSLPPLAADWKKYGAAAFSFTILEELEKKPEQTQSEFLKDLELLKEIWAEKLAGELY